MAKARKKARRTSSAAGARRPPTRKSKPRTIPRSRAVTPNSLLTRLRVAYVSSALAVARAIAKELTRQGLRGELAWTEAESLIERYRNGNGGRDAWIFSGLTALALSNVVDDALDPSPGDEPRPSTLPEQAFHVARHDVFGDLMELHDMDVD